VSELWQGLSAAGGSLALAFIVALVLGICANAVLFFGSAVVVLERFARGARGGLTALVVTAVLAALLGTLGTDEETIEALGIVWPGTLAAWAASAQLAGLALIAAQLAIAAVLRFLAPRTLARVSVVVLGAGYALLVGGLDQLGYALAPALAGAAAWLVLRWRRRRRGVLRAGFDERLALSLTAVLTLGAGIPLALSAPALPSGSAGATLLTGFVALVLLGLLPRAAAGFVDAIGTAEWFIARRYLLTKRRQTFISVITGICVAGVAAGVWLIVIVLSVMNGFEQIWRDEIIGNRAHLTVHAMTPIADYREVVERVSAVSDVKGASPYVDAEGMVRGQGGGIVGVRVRGIDPERVGSVTDLRSDLLPGSEDALEDLAPHAGENGKGDPGIVVGSQLAGALGVGIGDPLVLISPFGGPPTPGCMRIANLQSDDIGTYPIV
jgi:hypothetical protein